MFNPLSDKRTDKRAASVLALLGLLCTLLFVPAGPAAAAPGDNVTQNWPAAAVFYEAPCPDTPTFSMTEEAFLACKTALESRVVLAYSQLLAALPAGQRLALEQGQQDWIACYYAYLEALAQLWDDQVKVWYGTDQERRTNIYRDAALGMLLNRAYDLESWLDGCYAALDPAAAGAKALELKQALTTLQVDMGLCLYVTGEQYRAKITAAHRAFYTFYDSNLAFVQAARPGDQPMLVAEGYLQVQRMSYLTHLHYQGCRFFHREREE